MLQLVNVGHKSLGGLRVARVARSDGRRSAASPSRSQGKRIVHLSATAFGGGVAEINYTLVPLMARRRARRRVADHPRRRRVLRRHEDDPQRAAGRPARAHATSRRRRSARYNALNAEQFEDDYDYVIVHDPQPAAMIEHVPGLGRALDLALPHRPLDAEPSGARRSCAPSLEPLRRGDLPHARVRAAGTLALPQAVHLAAGDRPADAEEHGALGRGRRVHRRPVRDRRRAAAPHPGLALRSRGRTRSG